MIKYFRYTQRQYRFAEMNGDGRDVSLPYGLHSSKCHRSSFESAQRWRPEMACVKCALIGKIILIGSIN